MASNDDNANLPEECCAKCRFGGRAGDRALGTGNLEAVKDDRMICQRFPPQVTHILLGADGNNQAIITSRGGSPVMNPNGWCGEFQVVKPKVQH